MSEGFICRAADAVCLSVGKFYHNFASFNLKSDFTYKFSEYT
jgi:hypothetical protein